MTGGAWWTVLLKIGHSCWCCGVKHAFWSRHYSTNMLTIQYNLCWLHYHLADNTVCDLCWQYITTFTASTGPSCWQYSNTFTILLTIQYISLTLQYHLADNTVHLTGNTVHRLQPYSRTPWQYSTTLTPIPMAPVQWVYDPEWDPEWLCFRDQKMKWRDHALTHKLMEPW